MNNKAIRAMAKQAMPRLEHDEAVTFAAWLELTGLRYTHLAQETFTKSWATKARNKAEGVKTGFPDYCVVGHGIAVFVELKKIKGGKTSEAQAAWVKDLKTVPGCRAAVCAGADAAIRFVTEQYRDKIKLPRLT